MGLKKISFDIPEALMKKMDEISRAQAKVYVKELWQEKFSKAVECEISLLLQESSGEKEREKDSSKTSGGSVLSGITKDAVFELDEVFLSLVSDFVNSVTSHARSSTEYILKVSSNFLTDQARSALEDFHMLYFGSGSDLIEASQSINREVDSLMAGIKRALEEKGEVKNIQIIENEREKLQRLSLSGLQKQLEMIISLDVGIKEKLIPILSSMQFEDMLSHRLAHVMVVWEKIIQSYRDHHNIDVLALTTELKALPTSQLEREQFYRTVLGEVPPEGIRNKQSIFDILF